MIEHRNRILVVQPILPYPPDIGARVVTFGLIQTLQREFDVTVLARLTDRAEAEAARQLEEHCSRVVAVMAPSRKSIFHRVAYKVGYTLTSWLRRRSMKSLYDCPRATIRAARRLANEEYDLIVLVYWQLYPLLDVFPADKTILLTYDVEMLVNRQNALLEKNLFRKIAKVRRWLMEQREEVGVYCRARRVLGLTERDASAVRVIRSRRSPERQDGSAAEDDVQVLPFGLDVDAYPAPATDRNPGEVLFLGAMGASFNRDALDHFVLKIFPHLDDVEGLSVTVVGGNLPRHLEHFGQDRRVLVAGRVPDVRPYLDRAACLVVPLRFGGGLRIRILEAMMAGTPIVCSSVAIAGMDFEPESEFLLADTPKETAAQIKRLLEDPSLGRKLSRNAREAVVERYDADTQSGRVLTLFRDILSHE